ncbi:MAG: thiolase domain-containing protein [Anaerolineae bacterium]|nr:thiolase domain-containing protein [Anaerolineae bacterium]
MRDVSIIGVGQTPVGEHWESSLRDLGLDAMRAALQDAGLNTVDALVVGNALSGAITGQQHLGALLADVAGWRGIESYAVEAAEASGGAALRAGWLAVASGAVDVAMVVGVEKMSDATGPARVAATTNLLDVDYEAVHGATAAALAGLLMRLYMDEYGVALEQFEGFSINAHVNGSRNPGAMFRNVIKPGRFASAPVVAPPVNLFDSAPDADGAAALILAPSERALDMAPIPVRVAGSAVATDALALHDRPDPLVLAAANRSAGRAFAQAGVDPADVNLFEMHDSFTVISALSLEACGFAERGQGWRLAVEGQLGLAGHLPISTFGGLKARGNPLGATGVYQAVEAALQLRGQAGVNQVEAARVALVQNLGGLGATAVTHVLTRSE